jgi:hypothetical protein
MINPPSPERLGVEVEIFLYEHNSKTTLCQRDNRGSLAVEKPIIKSPGTQENYCVEDWKFIVWLYNRGKKVPLPIECGLEYAGGVQIRQRRTGPLTLISNLNWRRTIIQVFSRMAG